MLKYIHNIDSFKELFDKIKFHSEKYGASYTAMMFYLDDENRLNEFWEFLLKYLRISDTVYKYSKHKILVILEETSIRWATILNERLRDKIEEKWFKYDYYCSAIQWEFMDSEQALFKNLKKRIKKALECNTKKCVSELSCMD